MQIPIRTKGTVKKTTTQPLPTISADKSATSLPKDQFTPSEIPSNGIMGGLDSPCFYNGKVMTIREARELSGWTPPPPPTDLKKPTLQDLGLDPKDLLK